MQLRLQGNLLELQIVGYEDLQAGIASMWSLTNWMLSRID
jgi:hypothetical protein